VDMWLQVFGYLLFMVLILPSIGLTTMRGLVENVVKVGLTRCLHIETYPLFYPPPRKLYPPLPSLRGGGIIFSLAPFLFLFMPLLNLFCRINLNCSSLVSLSFFFFKFSSYSPALFVFFPRVTSITPPPPYTSGSDF
jgi:hypothetical protein